MSFFSRGGSNTPSAGYNRVPDSHSYRSPQPYARPPPGYNDPSTSLFERRSAQPSPRPSGGASVLFFFIVVASPNDALALTNRLVVHPSDFQQGQHVLVKHEFSVTPGCIGASAKQRQWMGLSMAGDAVSVDPIPPPPHPAAPSFLQSIDIEVGYLRRGYEGSEVFSADEMMKHFLKVFAGTLFTVGELIVFEYHGQNLQGTVKSVGVVELADEQRRGLSAVNVQRNLGIIMERTDVTFLKAPDSLIKIKSSAKKAPPNAILAPNFKFEDMGIGGLDNEFNEIFRRAFASRVFPPGLVEKLGIEHVKGILLHGPPGTGKTLIARQIGKMLNAREPKIVNGPEILSKYVGASEENIRKLFADAEKEYKEKKDESGLHIIIFDELDAIFKQRGTTNNGTGVGDTVVNQLLSKMDGVDQLNNILIIGMTNRKDLIDEALLRPGRLEVHMEISLPDEHGRLQILSIHTAKMRHNGVMDDDVDLAELAALTKNFSGAEIGGLIKSATSFAFNRHVKVGTVAGISDDVENLRVNRGDFMNALNDVHPAFGVSEEELAQVIQSGIIHYDAIIDELLRSGQLFVEQVRTSMRTPLVSVLLHGPPGSGKTALAASIAQESDFPFIKLISSDNMVGYPESQKVSTITKIFTDAYKSPLSVVVVDNIERLIDWTPMGARFSNSILQALLVLLGRRPPKGRRLLVLATTSVQPILSDLGFAETFDAQLRVPPVSTLAALERVVRELDLFTSTSELRSAMHMLGEAGFTNDEITSRHIGMKKLLSVIEMARQEPDNAAERLTTAILGL
ncbi:vesicular-fusion protein SEC18 [Fistulina hepatica ATCC 64428]|uniref:Vesicular-fusion protein SEC18 n=1 Tax=Fistulina hepatica ATCC 64428 TaxID=1128425 RepID=A0A0D7ANF8_9AGAR|nr:vesicular-fusion protein SEC18 [Fistulina hepatica ATCC 64428]